MSKNIVVTGVNGFVGQHLARTLHEAGHQVIGIGHNDALHPSLDGIAITYYPCDLTDPGQVSKLPLKNVDAVISLAGLAKVGDSFANPDLYMQVNVNVLSVLCEKLLVEKSTARIIAVSTGAVYRADQAMPLTESSDLITTGSPYALSKIAMEQAAARFREEGLDCVIVRPFNHIGPGQGSGFLVPDLLQKIIQASKTGEAIKIGSLTTRRDYTDGRDVVRAYADLALAENLHHSTYNVCSGESIEGQRILDLLLAATGQAGKVTIEQDPSLLRPDDPKELYGSNQRLHNETNWQPTIPLEQTIHDIVNIKQESV